MYIDQKFTCWKRFYFPNNIEIPEFKSENEVEEFIFNNVIECEILDDIETDLAPYQNNMESTLEVYDNNDDLIWKNGK